MAGAIQNLDYVGQVIFVRRIIRADLEQIPPQQISLETIDAGVDKRNRTLFGRRILMLDDAANLAGFAENDSAVASGVIQTGGNQRGGGVAGTLAVDQFGESCRREQRAIAIQHDDQAGFGGQRFAARQQRMAGAFLLGLVNKTNV